MNERGLGPSDNHADGATDNQPPLPMPQSIVDEEMEQMQDACRDLLQVLSDVRPALPAVIYDYGVVLAKAPIPDVKLVESWHHALGLLRYELTKK